jgi:hypothetical protein
MTNSAERGFIIMKKFRKIMAFASTALLLGVSTMAGAVMYPADVATNNVAVVYGANSMDSAAATSVANDLVSAGASVPSGSLSGGEVFEIRKKGIDELNFGDGLQSVLTDGKLDDKDFPILLADGIVEGLSDTEYDFNQKIYLADETTELIVNNDLNDKEPTLGIYLQDRSQLLSYNITYEDTLNFTDIVGKELPILGKDYYVLSNDATNVDDITLLDTAASVTIQEGETTTVTVDGVAYEVSVSIYEDGAVFTVNGVQSDQLSDGGYDKLTELSTDGNDVYIVAKDVRYGGARESSISEAEFSIGAGKIVLDNGKTVKLNNDNVDGLTAAVSNTSISLSWEMDEDQFFVDQSGYTEMTMPLFGAIKVVYGGIDFPATTEETELTSSENYITLDTEILDGSLSLPILYRSSTTANFTGLGQEAGDDLFTSNASTATSGSPFNLTIVEDQNTAFVVTYIKGDDAYSYAFRAPNSAVDEDSNGDVTLDLDNLAGGDDISFSELTDYVDLDEIQLTLVGNASTENATIQVSTSVSGATVYADMLVTADGLQMMLPVLNEISRVTTVTNTTAEAMALCASLANSSTIDVMTYNATSTNTTATVYCDSTFVMNFTEEDKDRDIAAGESFNATISSGDTDGVHVSATSLDEQELQSADDNYVAYVSSELASKVEMDKSGDTNTFVVNYNGAEVTVDLKVASSDATSDSGSLAVMDSESSAYSGKDIVVVGGPCINTVAADLLGGKTCGMEFTTATGVGAGEYMMQAFAYGGETAVLVAGYDKADTTNAVNALVNDGADLTVGGAAVFGPSTTA